MRLPARLLQRKAETHKGDYGHIFILGGCARYPGAAVLCAEAAMRTGAGLVTLGIPRGINNAIIKIKPEEVMTYPLPETKEGTLSYAGYRKTKKFIGKIDILVVGPGLGQHKSTQRLASEIVFGIDKPMVVDADGLNALEGDLRRPHVFKLLQLIGNADKVFTPHPGEMAKLLGVSVSRVQKNRIKIAQKTAKDNGLIIVLKGHNTVVCGYKNNLYINKTGNPGMATAGSGDVLTGMIAAFLGQGLNAFDAAKYAVYLHGLAGDLAAEEKTQISLIASDIIAKIPKAIKLSS